MKYFWILGTCTWLAVSVGAQTGRDTSADVPPLMLATLLNDAARVEELLKRGADPNQADGVGATALMWAVPDIEKTRRLLDHGANVNARSSNLGRTPFLIAAGVPGSVDVLTLLLQHGADLQAKDTAGFSALAIAMAFADLEVVRFLIARGLDPNDVPVLAARTALARARPEMIEYLMARGLKVPPDILIGAANWQSPDLLARWIKAGADVNARNAGYGATPLLKAASSELAGAQTLQLLLEHGANANAESTEGERSLDWAIYRGDLAKKAVLEKFGATRGNGPRQQPVAATRGVGDPRLSVTQSVALLLKSAPPMFEQRRCFTCHHNSMPAEAAALARRKGISIPEDLARKNLDDIFSVMRSTASGAVQGRQSLPGGITLTVGYGLMALAAERYPLDPVIASHVHWMLATQMPDGSWLGNGVNRPPGEFSTVSHTAIAVRGLTLYPIPDRKPEFDRALQRAAKWLATAQPSTTEERAMRLMGLVWSKAPSAVIRSAVQEVVRQQRPQGGWSQLPALEPDAYATGLSLVALNEAGMRVDEAVYRRGVSFLLATQYPDGAWLIRTRAFPVQPYFESGFPFDRHQWISAAGTAWAAQAIARTLPDARSSTVSSSPSGSGQPPPSRAP
jgi:ankyrin repeat protein